MKIERIEVRSVGPPTEQFTWSDDLPAQYATNTVLRMQTDDGVEAVSGVWNATSRQSAIIEVKTRVQLNVHCCGIPPAQAASAQQVLDAKFIRGTSWLIGQACTLVQD